MKIRIGGHVSFSRSNASLSFEQARDIGANTIQIFGASPVQWKAELPEKDFSKEFKKLSEKYDIKPIFLHAPYLVNIASPKSKLAGMSRSLLEKHLMIASELGAFGVIFHIGTRGDSSEEESEKKVVDAINKILDKVKEGRLIIENTAGAGNLVGDTLDEVGGIIKKINNDRIGFCYDTAHGFESGVLVDGSKESIDNFVKEVDKKIGIDKLWAIHTNDSKTPAESNKDRHENIGLGYIGEDFFRNMLQNEKLRKIPFILEVPGIEGGGPDKENIEKLISLSK